jgi:hypothetical protein
VFRTTDIGFKLLPNQMTDCSPAATTSYAMRDVDFEAATKAQAAIRAIVGDPNKLLPNNPPLFIDAALQPNGAYKALRDHRGTQAYNRMAVMLLVNRSITVDCGGMDAASMAAAAFNTANPADRIYTYVVMLNTSMGTPDMTAAIAIANAGGPPGAKQFFDATNPNNGPDAFNTVVSDLGSCLYEKPANIDAGAVISYTDPLSQQSTSVTFNASCTEAAQNTADGWNVDASRVRICGASCSALRDVLRKAADYSTLMMHATPNIPVTATQPCQ